MNTLNKGDLVCLVPHNEDYFRPNVGHSLARMERMEWRPHSGKMV